MPLPRLSAALVLSTLILAQVKAQQTINPVQPATLLPANSLPSVLPTWHPTFPTCNADEITAAKTLTLHQRACYYGNRMLSLSGGTHAAFSSAFGQWRNAPYVHHEDLGDFARRMGGFYARREARDGGEFLAGYLNREDPRPHVSNKAGFWNRSRSALLSVVATRDGAEAVRPALAPIAGAFGSGFVGAAYYGGRRGFLAEGMKGTGCTYGAYFSSALFREFKPDIATFATKLIHQK